MFLARGNENEIISVVWNYKNKKSTGYDNIDMTIIKSIIYHIVEPLTYIGKIAPLKMGYFQVK